MLTLTRNVRSHAHSDNGLPRAISRSRVLGKPRVEAACAKEGDAMLTGECPVFVPLTIGGDAAVIPLTQGKVALVGAADWHALAGNGKRWHAAKSGRNWYAVRKDGRGRKIRMHRAVLQLPDGMEVDHIDGDGLNNRRVNIRACTRVENQRNQRLQARSASGYKGVSWYKRNRRWQAHIKVNGKKKYLGYFSTEEAAAAAYDEAAVQIFGEFARLNNLITTRGATI